MKITNPITLDVARSNSYICLLAKQFDENSRFLIATLTNNGAPMIIPAGAAVTLRATRPDGEPVAVPGIINNDGTTTVEIDDYILEVVGSASLSIEVAIGDEILTSASFNLTIQRADGNGWLRVYVAAASLAAGNYYITIGDAPYAFTTTQTIPAGGSVYFASEGGTAQTRDASGNVLDASLPVSIASTGTELTSDVPTMSFLTAIAGRIAIIEAEMSQKADIDGSYPLLNAGTADNLMTDNGATQAIPFIQEGTGKGNGEATVKAGGVLQLKKKLGNTVAVNQLLPYGDFSSSSGWSSWYYGGTVSVANNIGTVTGNGNIDISHVLGVTIPAGHTVLFLATVKGSASGNGSFINVSGQFPITTSFEFVARIGVLTGSITRGYIARQGSGSFTMDVKNVSVIDLTLWFGSNDRIPSDLLSHPENWGRYYAGSLDYNAGTLESADGTVMKSIGRNFWDEEWELGTINTTTGAKETATNRIRSKNYIPVSPNTECYVYGVDVGAATGRACFYDANKNFVGGMSDFPVSAGNKKFTTPSNAHFMLFSPPTSFGTTYGKNITLSRFYTGESGYDQYYPYSVLAEVDTGSEVLRGDGTPEHSDSKLPDGTISWKRITYTITGNEPVIAWYDNTSAVYGHHYGGAIQIPNLGIAYGADTYGNASNGYLIEYANNNKTIYASLPTRLDILDDSYTTQAAWLAGITGTVLILDVATPTTEQGTAFAENIPCDPDGTLSWTQSAGVPQGNEIFYPADLKGALESIVAALPSANGTYTLHATVTTAGVTFSWS